MKTMMERPHAIRFDGKFIDDFVCEPTRRTTRRAHNGVSVSLVIFCCALLAVLWFLFGR
jgi:hypothetical protein